MRRLEILISIRKCEKKRRINSQPRRQESTLGEERLIILSLTNSEKRTVNDVKSLIQIALPDELVVESI